MVQGLQPCESTRNSCECVKVWKCLYNVRELGEQGLKMAYCKNERAKSLSTINTTVSYLLLSKQDITYSSDITNLLN